MSANNVRYLRVSRGQFECVVCGSATNMHYLHNSCIDNETLRDYVPLCFKCMKAIWESDISEYSAVKFDDVELD